MMNNIESFSEKIVMPHRSSRAGFPDYRDSLNAYHRREKGSTFRNPRWNDLTCFFPAFILSYLEQPFFSYQFITNNPWSI
jgi:hypothetical protein